MKGGARKGAGRKAGTANKKTREIADKAAAKGVTPLEFMLTVLRQPMPPKASAETRLKYDLLRFEAAKAAAPYIHPRLSPRDTPIKLSPAANLADQGKAVLAELGAGAITPDQASSVLSAIASQARVEEVTELAARVAALEKRQNGENRSTHS